MNSQRVSVNYHGNAYVPPSAVHKTIVELYSTLQESLPAIEQVQNDLRLSDFVRKLRATPGSRISPTDPIGTVTAEELQKAWENGVIQTLDGKVSDSILDDVDISGEVEKILAHNNFVNHARGNKYMAMKKHRNSTAKEVNYDGILVHRPGLPYKRSGNGEVQSSSVPENIHEMSEDEILAHAAFLEEHDYGLSSAYASISANLEAQWEVPKYDAKEIRPFAKSRFTSDSYDERAAKQRARKISAWVAANPRIAFGAQRRFRW